MAFQLTWLAEVLTRAGQKVSEVQGWQSRGQGDVRRIFGVICHHTAGGRAQNMPSLGLILRGRAAVPARPGRRAQRAIPGPLANLGLGRDGTFFIIAAGRANHAGEGSFRNIVNGNTNLIGIEAENTGLDNDRPWPAVQVDAYQRGVAAILTHVRQGPEFCIGHREWATPPGRKPDPEFGSGLDMNGFRARVAAIMSGEHPPRLIPPVERPEALATGGDPGRPTLRRGMMGELTRQLQLKLGVEPIGKFGPKTEAAVREFQRRHGLVPDGIVGPKTWSLLDGG